MRSKVPSISSGKEKDRYVEMGKRNSELLKQSRSADLKVSPIDWNKWSKQIKDKDAVEKLKKTYTDYNNKLNKAFEAAEKTKSEGKPNKFLQQFDECKFPLCITFFCILRLTNQVMNVSHRMNRRHTHVSSFVLTIMNAFATICICNLDIAGYAKACEIVKADIAEHEKAVKHNEANRDERWNWSLVKWYDEWPGLQEQHRKEYMEGTYGPTEKHKRATKGEPEELLKAIETGSRIQGLGPFPVAFGDWNGKEHIKQLREKHEKIKACFPERMQKNFPDFDKYVQDHYWEDDPTKDHEFDNDHAH